MFSPCYNDITSYNGWCLFIHLPMQKPPEHTNLSAEMIQTASWSFKSTVCCHLLPSLTTEKTLSSPKIFLSFYVNFHGYHNRTAANAKLIFEWIKSAHLKPDFLFTIYHRFWEMRLLPAGPVHQSSKPFSKSPLRGEFISAFVKISTSQISKVETIKNFNQTRGSLSTLP